MKRIQILGPGCPKCDRLAEHAQAAARALGIEAAVERVTDLDAIMAFGVLMTPALVVDGQVKMTGKVPSVEEVKKYLA